MGKLQVEDFDPSGKTEISFQEMIHTDEFFQQTPFKEFYFACN